MDINVYLSSYSSGAETVNAVVWAFKNKKSLDKVITHACASAIKEVIDGVRASKDGKSGNAQTVNEVLYWANDYMPEEARRIREFLAAFGPFTMDKKPFSIMRKGKPPLLVEPCLRFDQKKYLLNYAAKSSDFYARDAEAYSYNTYKRAMKAAEKQEAEQSKTEAERTKEAQEKLTKRVERIKKEASEAGISLTELGISHANEGTAPTPPDGNSLIAMIKAVAAREDLSKEDRQLCDLLLQTASNYYSLKKTA